MNRRAAIYVSVAVAVTLVASALAAAPIAQVRTSPGAVDFSPLIEAQSFVLTVSTPEGKVVRRQFAAGEAISFSISDLREAVAEGAYQWELTAAPRLRPADRAKLDAARAKSDPAALAEAQRAAGIPVGGWVQSGSFMVADGAIADASPTEPRPGLRNVTSDLKNIVAVDQVIPDDLIVQGSICAGFDCVNNEPFGFDTIKLKENNLRIKFEDTSVGSFPTNDWQLTANDSASGGSSKFSIEDITGSKVPFTITAGASTNSIFADSTGRIGLRTSTPVLDLHISTSNTPAIRLEQTNNGGFTAQTWDIGANEANFFVRDVTGGSKLSLRIRPGAPTSSLDISADGDIGMGTGSPTEKLHITGSDGDTTLRINETSGTGAARRLIDLENNGQVQFRMKDTAQAADWQFTASNAFQIDNTNDPGVELQVNPDGALLVNGTQMTVPDYVFAETYELMPLNELAAFVRAERHLPNVPTAEEIKANGLNLSQFPLTLLEKIEQLTLYTIELKDSVDSLASENAALRARLVALEGQPR